jgi:ribosomal protein S6--L-glutamate ligase
MPATTWILSDHRYLAQRMPAALCDQLLADGLDARVVVVEELLLGLIPLGSAHLDGATPPWPGFAVGDVVVPRTRRPHGLAVLAAAEVAGARVLNPAASVEAVRDKVAAGQRLVEAGIPTPATFLADRPSALRALDASRFPLLLKPQHGDNARGIVRVPGPEDLDDAGWPHGMVLAQQEVDVGGVDLKVYVAGDDVWAVRRPSPLAAAGRPPRSPRRVAVTATVRELVDTCRALFGLELFGLDVLEAAAGPLVVDVNDFPNYTGVDEAPRRIAALVAELVGGSRSGVAA